MAPRPSPLAILAAVAICLLPASPAVGQPTARLDGLLPAGPRTTLTEGWGSLHFTLTNFAPAERQMRVTAFFPSHPDVQYAREVWVPGESKVSGWVAVGPVPPQASELGRDIQFQLYDRVGETWQQVANTGDEKLRARIVPYRRREPTTAVYTDLNADAPPDAAGPQAVLFARVFRQAAGMSEHVGEVGELFLPPSAEGFDGLDLFVLASDRLTQDPAGLRAIRQWVERGGTLWVMLDLVHPETVAPILGGDLRFQLVDRTSLTAVTLKAVGDATMKVETRTFDRPVEFVRVVPGQADTPLLEVDGWPAAFSRRLGRGKVVFTTLGGRAWHRPRTARERRSEFEHHRDLPVELPALERLTLALTPDPETRTLDPKEFAPMLTADIGYTVVGRPTAVLILGGFVCGLIALAVWVTRSRHPLVVGWLGPVIAVLAAGAFVAVGTSVRRAVPATEGMVAVVDVTPGTQEASAVGLFAVYRPTSGETRLGSAHGGIVELNTAGLEGQARRRVQTDLDSWHWESLNLPGGVRTGPFRTAIPTGPVSAVARFGPVGVEGRLSTGIFKNPADAILLTPAREPVAVHLSADGTFTSGPTDLLPAEQFLADTVLTDRQRRRQEVFRTLFGKGVPKHLDGRDVLLVWAELGDLPFHFDGAERSVGQALLIVPLEFDRPAAGGTVTIPRGLIPATVLNQGRRTAVMTTAPHAVELPLRFQMPPSLLPLTLDKAALHLRVRAPSRRVSVWADADGQRVPLYDGVNPLDPIRVELTDPRLLRLDADGGLTLTLAISDPVAEPGDKTEKSSKNAAENAWKIESLTLEASGRVKAEK